MNVEVKSFTSMLPARPGTCAMCAVTHDPALPHYLPSMFYQMNFRMLFGFFPTWNHAMSHCTPEVKANWRAALRERGIDVPEPAETIEGGQTTNGTL